LFSTILDCFLTLIFLVSSTIFPCSCSFAFLAFFLFFFDLELVSRFKGFDSTITRSLFGFEGAVAGIVVASLWTILASFFLFFF
jgi:hypothetical protein